MQGRGEKWEASNEAAVIGTVRKRREIENQKKKREEENMSLKNNKYARRLAAALMTGAMMVSMMGMTAMAQGPSQAEPKNVTITKKITKDENFYAPNTTFTFTVELGDAVAAEDNEGVEIYKGLPGGATFAEGKDVISSTPKKDDIGKTEITVGTTQITVKDVFDDPGIYRYVVKETPGNYEGIGYTDEEKYFDIYVNSNGGVYAYTFTDSSAGNGKDDGVFVNDYSKKAGDEDTPHDLTIKKTVTGNQGDKTAKFAFELSVSGAEGEQYYVTYGNTNVTLTSGAQAQTIYLTNEQSAVIYGLSKGDKYTVKEIAANQDGYTTTIDSATTTTGEKSGNITADTTITYNNDRTVSTPTGVILNIAPYILMVALAGVLAFFFLRKRHYEM